MRSITFYLTLICYLAGSTTDCVLASYRVRRDGLLDRPWTKSTPQSAPFMNLVHGDGSTNVQPLSAKAYPTVNCLWSLKYHPPSGGTPSHFTDFCGDRLDTQNVLPVLTKGERKAIRENKDVVPSTEQQNRILTRLVRKGSGGRGERRSGTFGRVKRAEHVEPSRKVNILSRIKRDDNSWLNYAIHNTNPGVNSLNGQACKAQDCLGVLTYHKPSPQHPQGHFTDFCTNAIPAQAVLAPGQIPGRGSSVPRQGSLLTQKEIQKLAKGEGVFLDACRQTALANVLNRAGRPPVGGLFGGSGNQGGLFGGRKKRQASKGNQDGLFGGRKKRQAFNGYLCPRQNCLGWLEYRQPDASSPGGYFTDWCLRVIPAKYILAEGQVVGGDPNPIPGSLLSKGHLETLAKGDPILIGTCQQTALALTLAKNGYGVPPSQLAAPFALGQPGRRRRKRQLGGLLGGSSLPNRNPFLPPNGLPLTKDVVVSHSTPLCGPFTNVVHNSRAPYPCKTNSQPSDQNCLRSVRLVGKSKTDPNRYYLDACGNKLPKEAVEGTTTPTKATTPADPGIDQRTLDFTQPPPETPEATTEESVEETTESESESEETTETEETTEPPTKKPKRPTAIKTGGGAELGSDEWRTLLLKGNAASISRAELTRRRGG